MAYGSAQYGSEARVILTADLPSPDVAITGPVAGLTFAAPAGTATVSVAVLGPTATLSLAAPTGTISASVTLVGDVAVLRFGGQSVPIEITPAPVVDGVDGGTVGTGEGGTDGPPPTNTDGVDDEDAYDETDVDQDPGATDVGPVDDTGGVGGGADVFGSTGPDEDDIIPVDWEVYPGGIPALSTYPTPKRLTPIKRVSTPMPSPVLNKYGRPVDWLPTSKTIEDWGIIKVYCGTTDVTTLRGVHTQIVSYEYMEPFYYGPAEIEFPQISVFDTLGSGDLAWFKQGMNVTLKRLHPDGLTETNIWEGVCASWEPAEEEEEAVFTIKCVGAIHQTMLEPYTPRFSKDAIDIGVALVDALNTQPARRFAALPNVTTGILTRNRGSWQTRFDYALELLSTAYTADGTNQWTMSCNPGRFPVLKLKNKSQNYTVARGTRGVFLREKSDVTSSKNVIFGEGINSDGGRWRNTRYPTVTGAPTFRPLTWVSQNEPYTYNSEGIRTGRNPKFDPRRLRVATHENYGIGVEFAEGVQSARAELKQDVNPGWFGDLIFETDPDNGCKYDIRAGHNVGVRHHHGFPNRLFHVSHVVVEVKANRVTCTVDTNNRDSITLSALAARNRAAAEDPSRRLNPPRRKSRFVPDESSAYDMDSFAGFLNPVAVTSGVWKIRRIPAGDYGQIVRTEFFASTAAKFAIGIFSKSVSNSTLTTYVGDALAKDAPWDDHPDQLSDAGLLIAWGSKSQGMGYYPSSQDVEGAAITGVFRDDSSWDYISDDVPWLWVAILSSVSATYNGRLFPAAED